MTPSLRLLPLLPLLAALPAAAETAVRLADGVTLSPYLLLQADEAGFAQDRGGGQAGGFNARRMRLGGRLDVADQVQLGVIWDFGSLPGDEPTLFEASAAYTGLKPFTATVGVFKVNFSLESMQGSGDTLMLERAAIVTITRNLAAGIRREAVQLAADGDRYNASVALTAGQAGPGRDGDQRAVVARAAGLALRTDEAALHLGVSGEYVWHPARQPGRGAALSLSEVGELAVDAVPSALSTGRLPARSGGALGPEAGLAWRRLWLQGEWFGLAVDRAASAGGGTLRFSGWYAQAAYTVLGTPRRWEGRAGAWGAPKPDGGNWGALEVGVRHSVADLNSRDVRGGRQHVTAAAVNWWPVEPVRLSTLYEYGTVRGTPAARRFHAVGARAQLQF